MVQNLTANTGDIGDEGFTPGSEDSLEEGLQYSCLDNPKDRSRRARVHRVAESDTTEAA